MLSIAAPRLLSVTPVRLRQNTPLLFVIVLAAILIVTSPYTELGRTVTSRISETTPWPIQNHKDAQSSSSSSSSSRPQPKYKPRPTWTPPPVKDPFPMLMTSNPPPIPPWNAPKSADTYLAKYSLPVAPPLLIGFTRSWPMLLQTVVGYVTAGWPADQIYVVENTGVHDANARGRLSLQNPLYLNHTQLHMVGVNVVRTPVLMNFAQLQNFLVSLSQDREWPYYFWSHMDSFVLSAEEGLEPLSGPVGSPSYQTIYDLAVRELNHTLRADARWGARFFAYDHLALVNPRAYEDVGGFDTFIPYYMTDCDMHWRLEEAGWSMLEARAGIIQDVASVLDDLRMLYREEDVPDGFGFTDPNPPPPPPDGSAGDARREHPKRRRRGEKISEGGGGGGPEETGRNNTAVRDASASSVRTKAVAVVADPLPSFKRLFRISQDMFNHKHGDRERNTWQLGQRGGEPGEPYAYHALGFQVGIDVMTEAGREVFRQKWGHRGCDFHAAGLHPDDAWKVEKDWE